MRRPCVVRAFPRSCTLEALTDAAHCSPCADGAGGGFTRLRCDIGAHSRRQGTIVELRPLTRLRNFASDGTNRWSRRRRCGSDRVGRSTIWRGSTFRLAAITRNSRTCQLRHSWRQWSGRVTVSRSTASRIDAQCHGSPAISGSKLCTVQSWSPVTDHCNARHPTNCVGYRPTVTGSAVIAAARTLRRAVRRSITTTGATRSRSRRATGSTGPSACCVPDGGDLDGSKVYVAKSASRAGSTIR